MEQLTQLQKFLQVIAQHRWKMLLVFVIVMGGVIASTFLSPYTYRSQSKLFVRLGRENTTLDPTATLGQSPSVVVPTSREEEINSIIETLSSRVLIEKVVDTLGPKVINESNRGFLSNFTPADKDNPLHEYQLAVTNLTDMLRIEAVKKSNIILISCDAHSPELAQTVVTKVVDYYLDLHLRLNRNAKAHEFLTEQTARARSQLVVLEDEMRKAQNETGLVAPELQRQILVNRIGQLESELQQTQINIDASETQVKQLRDKLNLLPATHVTGTTTGLPNAAADTMRQQLYILQLRDLELTTKHGESHPEVKQTRKQIEAAKAILDKEEISREQITKGPNRLHEETQVALLREEPLLASLQAKARRLEVQLGELKGNLDTLTLNQLRISKLQRELDMQDANYRKYVGNLEQTQIEQALKVEKISNISIVQPASFELDHVRPRTLLNLLFGFVFALISSIGLAFGLDYLNQSSRALEDPDNSTPYSHSKNDVVRNSISA
jgi:uncharacterized protein involved in exopolysaccharide biosynthesis